VSESLEPGRSVGPYVVEALVGMGGMGAVYRARDTRLGRRVALKVVRRDREDHTGVAPEDRLIAEARAAAALRHPNVVQIFDAGTADGQTYVAMEYVEGRPLREWVGDTSVPLARRMRWLGEIGSALAAAHRTGLVHRDVKPSNVIIDEDGSARVLDFGLAKRLVPDADAPTADAPALETAEGRVLGTVSYMPPEQLAGGPPDPKWDQFAWGVMAYELLTGVHPRQAVPMPGQTAHLTQTPKMPNELAPEVPFAVAAAVMLAMAPDPERRFSSMDDALVAMRNEKPQPHETESTAIVAPQRASGTLRSPPRRWSFVVALLAAGAGGVAVGATLRRGGPRAATTAQPSSSVQPTASAPRSLAPPVASAAPATAPSASSAAAPASAPHRLPEDYGTSCTCVATEDGRLCPLGSDYRKRVCVCVEGDTGSNLSHGDAGDEFYHGRDYANGMHCQGVDSRGRQAKGRFMLCSADCNETGFAGVHRTRCRGVRSDGVVVTGLLLCY
jgi:serine/threonine protein kinase